VMEILGTDLGIVDFLLLSLRRAVVVVGLGLRVFGISGKLTFCCVTFWSTMDGFVGFMCRTEENSQKKPSLETGGPSFVTLESQ
jgi:hypothetical protein